MAALIKTESIPLGIPGIIPRATSTQAMSACIAVTIKQHATCFICSGFEKALLIDFNYETEPLPGKFPFPGLGPFSLLGESNFNYYGKMMFKWVYWNLMLEGLELPLENQMTMAGKMRQSI